MQKINLKNFFSDNPKHKYACAKEAITISKTNPKLLYSDFDFFLQFLEGENKILKWTAIQIIGNISKVDNKKKVDKLIPKFITLLSGQSLITAANTIGALAEIAKNKPSYQNKILKALLQMEKAEFYNKGKSSPECRNVAIGQVINSLDKFGQTVYNKKEVKNFLKRQTKNTRPKVRQSAKNLLSQTNETKPGKKRP